MRIFLPALLACVLVPISTVNSGPIGTKVVTRTVYDGSTAIGTLEFTIRKVTGSNPAIQVLSNPTLTITDSGSVPPGVSVPHSVGIYNAITASLPPTSTASLHMGQILTSHDTEFALNFDVDSGYDWGDVFNDAPGALRCDIVIEYFRVDRGVDLIGI